jgi:uncharacterized protein (TIGR02246 family)
MNKGIFFSLVLNFLLSPFLSAQDQKKTDDKTRDVYALIDNYSLAREKKDTALLKTILTHDVDQLVSTGEWRNGIGEAVRGMLRSSQNNPGTRTLTLESVRFLDSQSALADARYEIKNVDGTTRKMWSTFVVVKHEGRWKIAAIRNMLPSVQP